MVQFIKQFIQSFRAKVYKHYATKTVVRTLSLAHAQELAGVPGELWPQVKARQSMEIAAARDGKLDIVDRRSWPLPFLPSTVSRISQPLIKAVPNNIRRFSRTPVPHRALNLIKNSVLSLAWDISPVDGTFQDADDELKARIDIARRCFNHPNNEQSFQSFLETGLEDFIMLGGMVVEPQLTSNPDRPFKMWNVDVASIRFFPDWLESEPDYPKYAQITGLRGDKASILFYEDELLYVKDNPSVDTPFGLGKMEIAFRNILGLIGVQEMATRAGSDQTHKTWLWWENGQAPQNLDIIRRHLTNNIEGQAKVSLVQGMPVPATIDIVSTTNEDLLIPWQEMLIRMIANACDLSAMALNLERDVNRSTGEVLDDKDFRSAVVPTAVKLSEHFTRFILHKKLGWDDMKFVFMNLDDPDMTTKMDILSKQYMTNAITPNEIRQEMGRSPSPSPFSDLTQAELMLVQVQAQGTVADNNAANQSKRQSAQSEREFQMYQDSGDPSAEMQGSAYEKVIQLVKPRLIKPLELRPKMFGSSFTPNEVVSMTLGELICAQEDGVLPSDPNALTDQLEQAAPGILVQLAPDIRDYLDMLKDKLKSDTSRKTSKITPKAKEAQLQRYKINKHIPADAEKSVLPLAKEIDESQDRSLKDKRRLRVTVKKPKPGGKGGRHI